MANQTEEILQTLAERHFTDSPGEVFKEVTDTLTHIFSLEGQPLSLLALQERAAEIVPGTRLLPDGILLPGSQNHDLQSRSAVLVEYKSSRAHNSNKSALVKQFRSYCDEFHRKLFVIASWHFAGDDCADMCNRAGLAINEDVFFFYIPVQSLIKLSVERDGDLLFSLDQEGDFVHRASGMIYSSRYELPEPVTMAGSPWPRSGARNAAFDIVTKNPGLTRKELEAIAASRGVKADFGLVLTNSSERIKFEEAGLAEQPPRYTVEWPG
jgi:hypothetical protein